MFMGKKLKKIAMGLTAVLAAGIIAGCGGGSSSDKQSAEKKQHKIGIVQLVEHNALDAANKGFVDGLKKRGFEEGKNITIDRQNAQADQSNLQNIGQRFVNNKVDLICAIATPAAQTVANMTKDIPIVGTAITDYVGAKLAASNEAPKGNVTGTSDMNPIKEQVDLLMKIYPNAKTVGVVYCSSEVNSEVQVKAMKEYAESKGLKVETATISTVNDIQQAAQSLVGKVDVFYEPTDNIIASAMPTLVAITDAAKKGVICGEPNMVKAGGLITYGIDYYKLGLQTGEMAADVLEGKGKPATMPIQLAKDLKVFVNKADAERLGVKIPEDVLKGAETF
ncbi:ABC transporter substrate-binding protein [Schwartzia succinivorans]|jgi:putative ABC transport system substrate-binding protein|uniref:Putative ABC transport system substrate-binding protein n=1 Tax=Schwartzia succinivorans DSM 10502 TaxID=1123243 RepID=A0A1M5ANE0_9FIRM|nr:ABC transporter substrate-binding protein [Schwartzia succinivorans]MBQ2048139.1 ABC transporter substrate-binding protein [Schwartzia sp. (in: firmicutes)]MBQ4152312.1 ABC transporter substrate-binding protein [Schwartzia sp. (in: firmicutes)]SHF31781.1 putative ABC transport system substrate-binding protein [Schwartzia succinivorans DSM 10502]